jgi:tetratricopeptide (TPR) repeat protein
MLAALGLVAVLAAQPTVAIRSPYLDAVRRYGPGTEGEAIAALKTLRLRDADQVFEELDAKASAAATSRRLYPRALALHVEALATCDPTTELAAMRLHLTVLLRLIVRIEQVARDQRDTSGESARLAAHGRRLTLWALQYLREEGGLAAALETFEAVKSRGGKSSTGVVPLEEVEVRLARGALEELRATPDAVAQSARARGLFHTVARDSFLAREERRRVETAARVYEALIVDHPEELEAHLRLGRLLLRLGQPEKAELHVRRVAGVRPDARQAYLAALFRADACERQGRVVDAIAAYGVAQQHWPGAQSPAIGVARLHALSGAHQDARLALTGVYLERAADAPERSDPWVGYMGGQAWRLPSGIAALQASFGAEP